MDTSKDKTVCTVPLSIQMYGILTLCYHVHGFLLNSCTKCVGSPGIIHDCTPKCHGTLTMLKANTATTHILTLLVLRLYFNPKHKEAKIFEKHLNPAMLVFIGWLSLCTLKWVPLCHGFNHFLGFCINYVLVKLATSSVKVNPTILKSQGWVLGLCSSAIFLGSD